MEAKIKQRVIGGLVLVAVVAIFLPLLFHHAHPSMNLALSTDVPNAPNQPQVQLQLPADPHADNSSENSTTTSAQNSMDSDTATTISAQTVQTAAEKMPKVTQKILNTQPAPTVAAQPAANSPAAATATSTPATANANGATPAASTNAAPSSASTPAAPASAATPDASAPQSPASAATSSTLDNTSPAPAATPNAAAKPDTSTTPPPSMAPQPAAEPMATNNEKAVKTVVIHTPQRKKSAKIASSNLILQIASFANPDNATRLVQQLRAKGIDAHINKQTAGISRVYVGPLNNRAMAVQLQQKLKQQWHLTGVIKNT